MSRLGRPVEANTTREFNNPFRWVQLLRLLAEAAPHRCSFKDVVWSPEHADWFFYWGVPGLDNLVFKNECTPTKIDDAWAFFGPLASELKCFPRTYGDSFLEAVILEVIDHYQTGGRGHERPIPNDNEATQPGASENEVNAPTKENTEGKE